jgi:RIO-like serine/threonine protein kinase
MEQNLEARHARRLALLRALYDRVDSSVSEFVGVFEIGETLGIDRSESLRILEYLEEKGLVKIDDHATGTARLTAAGVDRVELPG